MFSMEYLASKGKVCPIICLVLALGIQLGIMVPYFGLSGIASNYNTYYTAIYNGLDREALLDGGIEKLPEKADIEYHDWYDQCGFSPVDWVTEDEAEKTSTGWTTAFKYNAMIYLVLMIITALMLCCMILPGVPPSAVTGATGILICFVPLLLAGAILSTMRLNSPRGNACH